MPLVADSHRFQGATGRRLSPCPRGHWSQTLTVSRVSLVVDSVSKGPLVADSVSKGPLVARGSLKSRHRQLSGTDRNNGELSPYVGTWEQTVVITRKAGIINMRAKMVSQVSKEVVTKKQGAGVTGYFRSTFSPPPHHHPPFFLVSVDRRVYDMKRELPPCDSRHSTVNELNEKASIDRRLG